MIFDLDLEEKDKALVTAIEIICKTVVKIKVVINSAGILATLKGD